MLKKFLLAALLAFSINSHAAVSTADFDKAFATVNGSAEERRNFLNFVLKNQSQASSLVLFFAARNAMEIGDIQDAGFLFFAAQLRARLDFFRYPSGASNAQQAIGSVQRVLGEVINPAVMQDPKDYVAILGRIKSWNVVPDGDYSPGWLSKEEKSNDEIKLKAAELKSGLVTYMSNFATLIQIPEYHKAAMDIRTYNTGPIEGNPISKEHFEAAKNLIKHIEAKKGVSVLSGLF